MGATLGIMTPFLFVFTSFFFAWRLYNFFAKCVYMILKQMCVYDSKANM